MAVPDDPSTLVQQAQVSGQLSASAAANIGRWLGEPPFASYRDRLVEDIRAGNWKVLDDAFYAVLEFGTGGRRGRMYPVGTNVLNERTIAESARGWPTTSPRPRGRMRPGRCADRPRHPAQLARVRPDLRPGPGLGRVQGPPVRRPSVDPPALVRRPPPRLRLRDHDHRVAQRAERQRVQVLLRDRGPGGPARRLGDHRAGQGRLGPRDPPEGLRRGDPRRLDRPGRARGRRRLHHGGGLGVGQPRPRPRDRLHPVARRGRDLGGGLAPQGGVLPGQHPGLAADPRRRLRQRPGPRLQPRDPQDARPGDRRGQEDRRPPGPRLRPRRRPDRRGPARHRATPRASGPRSTATRSGPCSPPS